MVTFLAANARSAYDFLNLPFLLLAAALAVAMIVAYRVYRDVKEEPEELSTSPDDLLGPLTQAYASGQMSEEEYHRIRDSIVRGVSGAAPLVPSRPKPPAPAPVPEGEPAPQAAATETPPAEGSPTAPPPDGGGQV